MRRKATASNGSRPISTIPLPLCNMGGVAMSSAVITVAAEQHRAAADTKVEVIRADRIAEAAEAEKNFVFGAIGPGIMPGSVIQL